MEAIRPCTQPPRAPCSPMTGQWRAACPRRLLYMIFCLGFMAGRSELRAIERSPQYVSPGGSDGQSQPAVDSLRRQWTRTDYGGEPLVRPTVLLVTAWDQVWVVDTGYPSVVRWSVDGEELPPVGRTGVGPGEYRRPSLLVELGDSVGVWDRQLQRMTFFDRAGEFLSSREVALSADSHGFMTSIGFRNDTSLVMSISYPGPEPGPRDNTAVLWRFVGSGSRADSLLSLPGYRFTTMGEDGYLMRWHAPFSPRAYALFDSHDRVLLGHSGDDNLTVYDYTMGRLAVTALGLPALDVSRENKTAYADSLSATLEENVKHSGAGPSDRATMRAINRRILRQLEFPATHPRYTDAFLGVDGFLWMRLPAETDAQHLEWRAYDATTFSHTRTVYIPNDGPTLNTRTDGRSFFVTRQDDLGQSYLAKYGR